MQYTLFVPNLPSLAIKHSLFPLLENFKGSEGSPFTNHPTPLIIVAERGRVISPLSVKGMEVQTAVLLFPDAMICARIPALEETMWQYAVEMVRKTGAIVKVEGRRISAEVEGGGEMSDEIEGKLREVIRKLEAICRKVEKSKSRESEIERSNHSAFSTLHSPFENGSAFSVIRSPLAITDFPLSIMHSTFHAVGALRGRAARIELTLLDENDDDAHTTVLLLRKPSRDVRYLVTQLSMMLDTMKPSPSHTVRGIRVRLVPMECAAVSTPLVYRMENNEWKSKHLLHTLAEAS